MNTKLLIDAIVRQTTVLIAQLSTAAGIRAPLAHVADQVFVELSRELEAQGLGKRVVADMFGMLLRGYQKKVQRLSESATTRDKSLWQAVLEFVSDEDGVTRKRVFERFERDVEEDVASVLRDLVTSGLVFASGQGHATLYRATTEEERRKLFDADRVQSLIPMLWVTIFHDGPLDLPQLLRRVSGDVDDVRAALETLRADGRVTADDSVTWTGLRAATLLVPVDAAGGWEAEVLDQFQAVATAVGKKVQSGQLRASERDAVGGATLRFELSAHHPHRQQVYSLLQEVRERVNQVWNDVLAHNEAHPIDEAEKIEACFYFGQYVTEPKDDEENEA